MSAELHPFLNKYFKYYANLDSLQQRVFRSRVNQFSKQRTFVGLGGQAITDSVKSYISSFAIQLTLGLNDYMFPYYKDIVVYPSAAEISPVLVDDRAAFKSGEIHIDGKILFNFSKLVEGEKIVDDGFNIGIHEFAKALLFENFVKNESYDFIDDSIMDLWTSHAADQLVAIRDGVPSIFRKPMKSNFEDLFAVVTECFFEKSEAFRTELPELYVIHSKILKQDPFKKTVGG